MGEAREMAESMGGWQRTHHCAALRLEHVGQEVVLMGWVNARRDLGNLIFVDLRDREGLTQVVFDPQVDEQVHRKAHQLRNECVVAVRGKVFPRLEGQENPDLETGAVEVRATGMRILNASEPLPFQVDGPVDGSETLRLKYRYLELRRPHVFRVFRSRHRMAAAIRAYLDGQGFVEVETPFLTRSTPEGARDYLVPSRVNRGSFYALPQSPQLFKQLLMIGGFDRYYQIVRCFRDEDLRADRQPEFTQVDLEMAFVDEEGVMGVVEGMMGHLFQAVLGREVSLPFPRMTYETAMSRYGTDRPDTRFGMEMEDVTDLAGRGQFRVFLDVIGRGGIIKGIRVAQGAEAYSRKGLDALSKVVEGVGAKGLSWIKLTGEGWQSPLGRFFGPEAQAALSARMGAGPGDLILMVADSPGVVHEALGTLRLHVAAQRNLIKQGEFSFLWITDFPLVEYDAQEGRYQAVHHPFTAPKEADEPLLETSPEKVKARAYDLVLNGAEVGGGSVRIHRAALQERVFRVLRIPPQEAQAKFGFLLEALRYGAPPHGGMALGFDRLVAILNGISSIRETIAFPKTTRASCPLTEAPTRVSPEQLRELGLALLEQ